MLGTALLVALLGVLPASQALALAIDTFEDGPFALTRTIISGSAQLDQSGLGVLGGFRFLNLDLQDGTQLDATLSLSGGDDAAALTAYSGSTGVLALSYSGGAGSFGSLNADLSFHTVFRVDVANAQPGAQISIFVLDTLGGKDSVLSAPLSGPGVVSLAFSSFSGVDFSSVKRINLGLLVSGGGAVSVSSFSAIPEPSSALLFVSGFAALGMGRRRTSA